MFDSSVKHFALVGCGRFQVPFCGRAERGRNPHGTLPLQQFARSQSRCEAASSPSEGRSVGNWNRTMFVCLPSSATVTCRRRLQFGTDGLWSSVVVVPVGYARSRPSLSSSTASSDGRRLPPGYSRGVTWKEFKAAGQKDCLGPRPRRTFQVISCMLWPALRTYFFFRPPIRPRDDRLVRNNRAVAVPVPLPRRPYGTAAPSSSSPPSCRNDEGLSRTNEQSTEEARPSYKYPFPSTPVSYRRQLNSHSFLNLLQARGRFPIIISLIKISEILLGAYCTKISLVSGSVRRPVLLRLLLLLLLLSAARRGARIVRPRSGGEHGTRGSVGR
jgi:hypothetical protein